MSLVPDYSGSSSSDSNDSDSSSAERNDKKEKVNQTTLLPSASNLLAGSKKSSTTMGVFSNPYFEAETTKQAALEQHVKMIKPEEYIVEKNGKKICWKNRRGRCHFGNKCQYAHDSDIVQDETAINHTAAESTSVEGSSGGTHSHSTKRKHTGTSSLPAKRSAGGYS